jgi:hypothetical protein
MTTTFTKHAINDFSNGLDTGLLHSQISDNSNIGSYLIGINTDEDYPNDINIIFSQSLSSGELDDLNEIITNHEPIQKKNVIARIYSEERKINNDAYTFIGRFNSLGKNTITGIDVLCYIDKKAESLEIDFVSRSNNASVAYGNFTNETSQNNSITPTSEISDSDIIDIFARVGKKKKKGYIDEIIIWN